MVTLVAVGAAGTLLAGCNPPSVEEKLPESLGNAVAPASPGQDKQLEGAQAPAPAANGLVAAGEVLALRSGQQVLVGTQEQFTTGQATAVDLPQECFDLTVTDTTFVVACSDGAYLIDAANPNAATHRPTDTPISSAVLLSTGELITAARGTNTVSVHRDGQEPKQITVEDATDNLVRVAGPVEGDPDRVYRINREFSLIQTVEWQDNAQGAVLRAGLGVGDLAPGDKGMALTTDAIGGQFGVYTDQSVIRLQQTTPTGEKPWAIAWASDTELVWTTTPATNQVHAYRIATGKGEQVLSLDTVPGAQHLAVLSNGTIVVASATGEGLHFISSPA